MEQWQHSLGERENSMNNLNITLEYKEWFVSYTFIENNPKLGVK
jgi:hypothetical protein